MDFFDKLPAKSQNKKLHFILRFCRCGG